jgi:hypothetical protein
MIVDLWQRGRRDILEARLADRFTTDELHIAYKRGESGLEEPLQRTAPKPDGAAVEADQLENAIDEYRRLAQGAQELHLVRPRAVVSSVGPCKKTASRIS